MRIFKCFKFLLMVFVNQLCYYYITPLATLRSAVAMLLGKMFQNAFNNFVDIKKAAGMVPAAFV